MERLTLACLLLAVFAGPSMAQDAKDLMSTLPVSMQHPCPITTDIVDYTRKRISGAKVSMDPYPHIYIEDVFEPEFYKCMMTLIPPNDTATTRKVYNNPPGRGAGRYRLKIRANTGPWVHNEFKKISAPYKKHVNVKFWNNWARYFGGRDMMMLWLEKFRGTVSRRKLDYNIRSQFYYFMELNRDLTGYQIGPHTDSENKWVTTLYYLPYDDSHISEGGTAVVKSKSGRVQTKGSKRASWKSSDWIVADRAPYKHNTVFAFSPCYSSWHAVPQVAHAFARDTIQGFVSSRTSVAKQKC